MNLTHIASTMLVVLFSVSTVGMVYANPMVFPSEGQSKEQQEQDEFTCHKWAKEETGIDPYQIAAAPSTQSAPSGGGEVVRGGARGAALGAIGGAIAGDAGEGAKIGAAVGGARGLLQRRRRAIDHQDRVQQEQAHTQADIAQYEKAWGLCMKAKKYEVG